MSAPRPSEQRRAGLAVLVSFGAFSVFFTGLFPPFSNPNELSRLQTVFAFVETGTFRIDQAIRVLGDHEDKAFSGGHFYSNKAPGLALAAIPAYRLLRVFFPPPRSASSTVFLLLRIVVVSSVCLLALARLLVRLAPSHAAPLVAFAVAFGTPYLFYARSFFGHAWTAAILFLAWDLLQFTEKEEPRRRMRLAVAGVGLLAGWAGISEYTAAPVALLLALRAASGRPLRRLALLAAGAAVPLALLLSYNALCFGSPWVLSSAREAHPAYAGLAQKGVFGFGLPSARVGWDYLFHPARGLLLFSPFWLWMIPGFIRWWRWRRSDRSDSAFAFAAVAIFFLLLTGYPNWHGGWSLGNRYLLPVLFFAALALGPALETSLSRGLFAVAAVFSVANHVLMGSAWPHFPLDLPWPPASGSLWFLSRGWIAPNLLSRLGWVWLLLAAAAIAATGAAVLRAARPLSPRASLGALLGLLPFCALLLSPPEPSYNGKLWRAAIYGAYSGLDPSRGELKRVVLSASTPSERRQAMGAWRLYGPPTRETR